MQKDVGVIINRLVDYTPFVYYDGTCPACNYKGRIGKVPRLILKPYKFNSYCCGEPVELIPSFLMGD